jgi:thiol-disulfide isomerase/thioredoxin
MVTEITMDDMIAGLDTPDEDIRILMFYGSTCGPCKATMPNYESSAKFYLEKNARIHFFKINAWEPEEQKMFCMKYLSDAGVPQFKAYYRGEEILNKIGGGNEETINNFIHSAVDTAFFRFQEKI